MEELATLARLLYPTAGEVDFAQRGGGAVDVRPLVIVRADCAYAHALWVAAFASPARRATWRVSHDSALGCHAAVSLDEYEALDWSRVLGPPFVVTSSFCMRKGLGRKANMAASLEAHARRCKAEGGCPLTPALPETVPIDTTPVFIRRPPMVDAVSAMAEALCEAEDAMSRPWYGDASMRNAGGVVGAVAAAPTTPPQPPGAWILKPSLTNKGAGIELVTTIEEVASVVRAVPEVGQWVLQRYIPRPLTLHVEGGGRSKFHIRVYALAVGALTVYMYHEALLLLAVRPYEGSDLTHRAAHITNTCVGVEEEGFNEAAHVRTLSELPLLLVQGGQCGDLQQGARVRDRVYTDMRRILCHAFSAQEVSAGAYMPLPRCFELYGVDFMVDETLNTWLLEFNPTPDIKQTGGRLGWVVRGMVEGAVRISVDRRVRVVEPGGRGQGRACEAHGCRDDAGRVEVDVEPALPTATSGMVVGLDGGVAPSPGPAWEGGLVDPHRVPTHVDATGWDMVYTKRWNQAHGGGHMRVS